MYTNITEYFKVLWSTESTMTEVLGPIPVLTYQKYSCFSLGINCPVASTWIVGPRTHTLDGCCFPTTVTRIIFFLLELVRNSCVISKIKRLQRLSQILAEWIFVCWCPAALTKERKLWRSLLLTKQSLNNVPVTLLWVSHIDSYLHFDSIITLHTKYEPW